ncbi:DNA topoisomerase II [Xylaria flabelliformis]|nr:DNA topoisomerase II [Xylaria flabelliformis]
MWVFNKETELMELRKVTFVPGLYKQRDPNISYTKVSIENNCKSIPVEIHHKEKVYIPKLVFGYLLVGSNFDEQEERTVGGRNGYRAILCNIFSAEFMLERFGMPGGIDNDLESLPNRLVYDMAGTVRNVKVYLGGLHLKLNFEKHCSMYAKAIARGREAERESDPRGL